MRISHYSLNKSWRLVEPPLRGEKSHSQALQTQNLVTLQSQAIETKKVELAATNQIHDPSENKGRKVDVSLETAGYLFFYTGSRWNRDYYEVRDGLLLGKRTPKGFVCPLANLLVSTVRPAREVHRRFCFEVVSPNEKFVFQAENEEILFNWIQIIQNAIAFALDHNLPNSNESSSNFATDGTAPNSFLQELRLEPANCKCADCGDESKFLPTYGFH